MVTLFVAITTSLLFADGATAAQGWKVLGTLSNGSQVIADDTSVRTFSGKAVVSHAIIYSKSAIEDQIRRSSRPINPIIGQEFVSEFDCTQRQYRYLNATWHYEDGRQSDMTDRRTDVILPNSPLEWAMEFACRGVPQR